MADNQHYDRTPLWGWVVILIVIAMFVGLVVTALGTGGG